MSQPTVWRILCKRVHMKSYWLQLLQALNFQDHNLSIQFCVNFQEKLQEDGFAEKIIFSSKATFRVSEEANRPNVRAWGTQNTREFVEHVRDSPKVNVLGAVSASKVYGKFFFPTRTVTGVVYLDILQEGLMPQLQKIKQTSFYNKMGLSFIFLKRSLITLMMNLVFVGLDVLLEMTIPFFCGPYAHLT